MKEEMSDIEADSSGSDEGFSSAHLRAMLKQLRHEIDGTIAEVGAVVVADLAPATYPLTQTAAKFFGRDASVPHEVLALLLERWKAEGRLDLGGASVRPCTPTATLLHLVPEVHVAWSKVWRRVHRLFEFHG